MFKPITSNSATNDAGVTVSIGKMVRYRDGDKTIAFMAQLCPPFSDEYGARFNLYAPITPHWEAPHEQEPLDHRVLERHMVEAMHALNCEVQFNVTTPRYV